MHAFFAQDLHLGLGFLKFLIFVFVFEFNFWWGNNFFF